MAAPMRMCRLLSLVGKHPVFRKEGLRSVHLGRRLACGKAEKWDLYSAVCLERPAVVSADLSQMEQRYSDMLSSMELERSVLSNHELQHKDDLLVAERRKADDYEDTEADATRVTALEMEDAWETELAAFTPAEKTTAADASGDKASHQRQLHRQLTLLVQQKLGNNEHWILPQGPRQEDETMRQAAERVLSEKCGSDLSATFLGNAPVGFYKYKYPADVAKNGAVGAKVFFFKALLKKGQVNNRGEDISDVAWLTQDELSSQISPAYRDKISRFIVEL